MLNLTLPKYEYLLKNVNEKLSIYDPIRKKYIVLTPEEWVRQHFINFLINYKNVPQSYISVENGLKYNFLSKRSDILVFNKELKPWLLIECKAPSIELNSDVLFQATTYNSKINSELIGITNGLAHQYWKNENNKLHVIEDLPKFE